MSFRHPLWISLVAAVTAVSCAGNGRPDRVSESLTTSGRCAILGSSGVCVTHAYAFDRRLHLQGSGFDKVATAAVLLPNGHVTPTKILSRRSNTMLLQLPPSTSATPALPAHDPQRFADFADVTAAPVPELTGTVQLTLNVPLGPGPVGPPAIVTFTTQRPLFDGGANAQAAAGVINVRDHGVKGDGVTDDTAAIQALLTDYSILPAVLYFPKGTYLVSGLTADLQTTGTRIFGDGVDQTIIKAIGTQPCVLRVKTFFLDLSQMTLDGSYATTEGVLVHNYLSSINTVHDLKVKNTSTASGAVIVRLDGVTGAPMDDEVDWQVFRNVWIGQEDVNQLAYAAVYAGRNNTAGNYFVDCTIQNGLYLIMLDGGAATFIRSHLITPGVALTINAGTEPFSFVDNVLESGAITSGFNYFRADTGQMSTFRGNYFLPYNGFATPSWNFLQANFDFDGNYFGPGHTIELIRPALQPDGRYCFYDQRFGVYSCVDPSQLDGIANMTVIAKNNLTATGASPFIPVGPVNVSDPSTKRNLIETGTAAFSGSATPPTRGFSQSRADGASPAAFAGAVVVNVVARGAKGDGVTNDQPAIQAAINSLPDSGGIVFFPNGVYKLNAPLTIQSRTNVLLVGSGLWLDSLGGNPWLRGSAIVAGAPMSAALQIHNSSLIGVEGLSVEFDGQSTRAAALVDGMSSEVRFYRSLFGVGQPASSAIVIDGTGGNVVTDVDIVSDHVAYSNTMMGQHAVLATGPGVQRLALRYTALNDGFEDILSLSNVGDTLVEACQWMGSNTGATAQDPARAQVGISAPTGTVLAQLNYTELDRGESVLPGSFMNVRKGDSCAPLSSQMPGVWIRDNQENVLAMEGFLLSDAANVWFDDNTIGDTVSYQSFGCGGTYVEWGNSSLVNVQNEPF
jgi:hypothetical protein